MAKTQTQSQKDAEAMIKEADEKELAEARVELEKNLRAELEPIIRKELEPKLTARIKAEIEADVRAEAKALVGEEITRRYGPQAGEVLDEGFMLATPNARAAAAEKAKKDAEIAAELQTPLTETEKIEMAGLEKRARLGRQDEQPSAQEMIKLGRMRRRAKLK